MLPDYQLFQTNNSRDGDRRLMNRSKHAYMYMCIHALEMNLLRRTVSFGFLSYSLTRSMPVRCYGFKNPWQVHIHLDHFNRMIVTWWTKLSVFGPERVLNRWVSAACPYPGWWCKENTRGFILVRAEEGPTSSGGREFYIFLHRGACVGVTSLRERAASPSLKERKEYKDDCLRCWSLSCVLLVVRCLPL
jgi:hypothetical protein